MGRVGTPLIAAFVAGVPGFGHGSDSGLRPAGQVQEAAPRPARTLRVGPAAEFRSIGEAIAASSSGDTLRVAAATYRERLVIRHRLTLLGEEWPVLDGGGAGHVVESFAPLTLRGFVIRGSGTAVDREDAGVMVRAGPVRIERNRLEDVFFGIYLKDAAGSVIRENQVRGKPLPLPRRGDGIRLWHSSRSRILGNVVEGTRDVVVYFSDSLLVADNLIRSGRYALHYMYSHHNRFLRNRFLGNQVGSFIMYSREIELRGNVFARAAGATGMGLGLKDADGIRVEGNLFVDNGIGIYLDNSPTSRESRNLFRENLLLGNGTGVHLLPSVRDNSFVANALEGNGTPVAVAGGTAPGTAEQNRWSGNHWSEYAGFDADGDGLGDTPFVHARLSDDLLGRHPELRLFTYSPALRVVDLLSRFFPLLRPEPVVVDSAPLRESGLPARWAGEDPRVGGRRPPGTRAGAALLWGGLALFVSGLLAGGRWRWVR
ncbi:MAG: nitrous oxide reductase family maturation protein NosD [Gemmatimonadota bacterium]